MVLFTLVAGFLPFEDPNTSALYKKILSGSYEKPNWLSDGGSTCRQSFGFTGNILWSLSRCRLRRGWFQRSENYSAGQNLKEGLLVHAASMHDSTERSVVLHPVVSVEHDFCFLFGLIQKLDLTAQATSVF